MLGGDESQVAEGVNAGRVQDGLPPLSGDAMHEFLMEVGKEHPVSRVDASALLFGSLTPPMVRKLLRGMHAIVEISRPKGRQFGPTPLEDGVSLILLANDDGDDGRGRTALRVQVCGNVVNVTRFSQVTRASRMVAPDDFPVCMPGVILPCADRVWRGFHCVARKPSPSQVDATSIACAPRG